MLDAFKTILRTIQPARQAVSGTVVRVGPYHGPAEAHGVVLLISESLAGQPPRQVVVLRDSQDCDYPIGLTKEGDQVSMQVSARGIAGLSSFKNKQLTQLLSQLNGDPNE